MGASEGVRSDERWGAVAQALKSRMAEMRITQKRLAADANVSIATLNELIAGTVRRRHPHTLAAISEALGWPADHILRLSQGDTPSETDPVAGCIDAIARKLDALSAEVATQRAMIEQLANRTGQPLTDTTETTQHDNYRQTGS